MVGLESKSPLNLLSSKRALSFVGAATLAAALFWSAQNGSAGPEIPPTLPPLHSDSYQQRKPASADSGQNHASIEPVAQPLPLAPELASAFGEAQVLNISERIVYWSKFLAISGGDPSRLASFGAGPPIGDSAPLIPDKFNCTTYVEVVAALARGRIPERFFGELLAIRYKDGKASFFSRNHFPEIDWIPNNQKAGIISDVTEAVAKGSGIKTLIASKRIDRSRWITKYLRNKGSRGIASVPNQIPSHEEAKVAYIPLADVERALDDIPTGAIVNIVRRDHPRHPVLISHQGFIAREKGLVMLRHSSLKGEVKTVPLLSYLKTDATNDDGPVAWPVIGINLSRLTPEGVTYF